MKNFLTLLFLFNLNLVGYAQNASAVDKEKLFDFYQTQRYADAAQYLKSIYGEEVNDFKTLSQIGYCFLMAGNNVEAENFTAKPIHCNHKTSLFSLVWAASITKGEYRKGQKYNGEIVQIDRNNFNVYKLLANLYPLPTDSMKLVYLLKANQINPLEGDVAADLAEVHAAYQQYEKAYDVLDIAIKEIVTTWCCKEQNSR